MERGVESSSENNGPWPYETELAAQREIIDGIDIQIVDLITQRAEAALEVGRIKARNGLPIYVQSREQEVIDRVCEANTRDIIPNEDIGTLFIAIMKTSRAAQQRLHDEQGLGNTAALDES